MKKGILIFSFLLLAIVAWAATVTPETALVVAENCYRQAAVRQGFADRSSQDLNLVFTDESRIGEEATPLFYVFSPEGAAGFVIVSGDDRVLPVLGYSVTQPYELEEKRQPEAFRKWMEFYRHQIRQVIQQDLEGDEQIETAWTNYLENVQERNLLSVDPLVSTIWDQPFPYNALCPQDPNTGQRAVVGCVATAMAQIMRYHAHPAQGTGFHSYNHPQFGTISANFGATTYNWSNMPNSISNFNEPIALLSFHCGVSIEMGYGVQVSGVSSLSGVASALRNYFSYSNTTQFVERDQYSDANWIQTMKSELDNSRPVEYAGIGQGGGHAWVMDGYDGDFFHMNWGWSGFQDGYFTLNNLNPQTGGTGAGNSGYNNFQQAVIGIQPATGGGGGGGGGDPDPTEYTNLEVYSGVTADPYPIQFAEPFTITVDIANLGNQTVTGEIAAAVFTEDGTLLEIVETLSGSLENGFFYSLEFNSDGLPTSPGSYIMGFFYRPANGEWTLIPPGQYSNPVTFEIEGPYNDIVLYAPIETSADPVVQGEPFQVTLDYANFGAFDYSGQFSVDLYTLDGEYIDELAIVDGDLCANCHYTNGVTFSIDGVDVEPGTYLLATWNLPNGGNWQIVGNGDYENPVYIQVAAPAIVADSYENNDDTGAAYNVNLSFSGAEAAWNTQGANMHFAEDQDYFRVDLPAGYQYEIVARAHDSYNSGNGQTYTNDVLFGINAGSGWSDLYDDVMDQPFIVEGGNTVYFGVAPYFVGTLGTYQLDINIERTLSSSVDATALDPYIKVGPNPSDRYFDININLPQPARLRGQVFDLNGRLVRSFDLGRGDALHSTLDLGDQAPGVYLLTLDADGVRYRRRLVVSR